MEPFLYRGTPSAALQSSGTDPSSSDFLYILHNGNRISSKYLRYFCHPNSIYHVCILIVSMNRWFPHHQRHLYTWKSPGDSVRNQIDYITMNKRFRNAVT